MRLDRWDSGSLKGWQPTGTVRHPEVGANGQNVGSDLYLGYGPLKFERSVGTTLKGNAAIQAGEGATLRIALTREAVDEQSARIAKALALMNLYGTLGGRSRNGWGSFALEPLDGSPALPLSLGASPLRPWRETLEFDWPHAIGQDEKGALIWQTAAFPDWKTAMRRLAEIKIALRTQFMFADRNPNPQDRHWLSYPVTHHAVAEWDKDHLRLPNSLRFRLRPDSRDRTKLRGIIAHVPCQPPPEFKPNRHAIESVWQRVHRFLDEPDQRLSRISA
jgi:CRISPR-associated protein Cmr1